MAATSATTIQLKDSDGFVVPQAPVLQLNGGALKPENEEEAAATQFPMPGGPQRAAAPGSRKKVILPPGHSHMDWVRLKSSGTDLRAGVNGMGRYTYSMIKPHNKPDDCWIALKGKVYNITKYLDFHPGGRPKLMAVAGKDATRMFDITHAWVNYEFLLDKCVIGFLIPEEEPDRKDSDDDDDD